MNEIRSIEEELALNEQRLLIFLETGPQSNKYNQIVLNSKQFLNVSNAIVKEFKKIKEKGIDGQELYELVTSEEEYTLPDLNSINE